MLNVDFSKITQAKFIKLGSNGQWNDLCFKESTVRLGYYEVPADYKIEDGKDGISDIYLLSGTRAGVASNHARQVYDFYAAGPETIWITFSNNRMWWCQTTHPVEFLGHDKSSFPHGSRLKRTLSGWRDCTASGKVLYMNGISGRLTSVAGYHGAICNIKDFDYLLRLLQDQRLPEVEKVEHNKKALHDSIKSLISKLTWADFELLTDLIFSRSGWQRISNVGGQMKTIDLELVMPITDERAIVQVKSSTTQRQLDEYIDLFQRYRKQPSFRFPAPWPL